MMFYQDQQSRLLLRRMVLLFACVVIYALISMTISREIIIPRMAQSVNGHIAGDPTYYNILAEKKAADIRLKGFSTFELRPEGQGPAGITSLLYLLWHNVYSVVLFNALLHGLSVVVMVLICMQWFSLRTSILAALPITISPYMIVWFSQINKDTFALAGALLFIYGFIRLASEENNTKSYYLLYDIYTLIFPLVLSLIGALLLWLVRPYVNQILLPITGLLLLIILILRLMRWNKITNCLKLALCGFVLLAFCNFFGKGAASDATIDSWSNFQSNPLQNNSLQSSKTVANKCLANIEEKNWNNVPLLGHTINNKLRAMMGQRCLMFTMLETQSNTTTLNSFIDTDKLPRGSMEALLYLPRAALQGIFSPWPDRWSYIFSRRSSVFYTIVPIETGLLYVGLAALCVWLARSRNWTILIPVFFSGAVMTIYGMATPFLGSLYRYRYPWWMLLIGLGLAALIEVTSNKSRRQQ